jgi:hypothetical protein
MSDKVRLMQAGSVAHRLPAVSNESKLNSTATNQPKTHGHHREKLESCRSVCKPTGTSSTPPNTIWQSVIKRCAVAPILVAPKETAEQTTTKNFLWTFGRMSDVGVKLMRKCRTSTEQHGVCIVSCPLSLKFLPALPRQLR